MVEDDPSMSQALARILRLGGYVPQSYRAAETLLDNRKKSDVVCMIVDVQLPGMDGFALHELLMALGDVPPVIFITAFDETEGRARAAKTGSAFLAKPFSGRILLETIRNVGRLCDPGSEEVSADTPC
jgi:FixJ family two-component response regulator